jgi:hypothetical protein
VNVETSAPFEASFGSGETGLVGTVEVAVIDNDGNVVIGPTTTNITEEIIGGVPVGIYTWNAPAAPAVVGQYVIVWSPHGDWDPQEASTPDELVVLEAGTVGTLPPIPAPVEGGLPSGPASAWTTGDAVALCCSAEIGTDTSVFDESIDEASQLLFELSGRRFLGLASKTVRPHCRCGCTYCQVLSRGHVIDTGGGAGCCENSCEPSRVLLSGYPVREITQVMIDGDVLAESEYGLYRWRWLIRRNNGFWPHNQNLTLADTEDGTWSVSYTYGKNPPLAGQAAAAELACEIYKQCAVGDCELPTGVSRITRQGITIERLAFTAWGLQNGVWRTGLRRVDAFLNAYNPHRLSRRPSVWSPASHMQYARPELT